MYDNILSDLPIYRVLSGNSTTGKVNLSERSLVTNDSALQTFALKLRQAIGRPGVPFSTKIGTHPDLIHLKKDQSARGSITSVFIDIKGSTQLFEKYDYEKAFEIQDAIIQSAIYIIQAFDGHIVRIPGDGIFAVFGRLEYSEENALLDSLNASSTILLILESYLSDKFQELGLKSPNIRVGIDYDQNALWKQNGIEGCHEISPHGLHVSLASKLQNRARANSIMIGENVRQLLQLPTELLNVKTFIDGGEEKFDRFVRNDYKMWEFDWEEHATHFSWVSKTSGKLLPTFSNQPELKINAGLLDSNGVLVRTFSSAMEVFNKGETLKFSTGPLPANSKINWFVENRGDEAEQADCLQYEVPDSKNRTNIERDTTYHGQHYLICKVTLPSGKIVEKRIGVFVGSKWTNGYERDVTESVSPARIPSKPKSLYIPASTRR